jgi:hypothetical protein
VDRLLDRGSRDRRRQNRSIHPRLAEFRFFATYRTHPAPDNAPACDKARARWRGERLDLLGARSKPVTDDRFVGLHVSDYAIGLATSCAFRIA